MTDTNAAPKAPSKKAMSKAEAEKLLVDYRNAKARKQEASEDMKYYEEKLHEFAEAHPDEFEGKTCVLESGKLKWVPEGKVQTPDDFDVESFIDKFPTCVKWSLPVGKVKEALNNEASRKKVEKFGLDIEYTDKFKVEV